VIITPTAEFCRIACQVIYDESCYGIRDECCYGKWHHISKEPKLIAHRDDLIKEGRFISVWIEYG